MKKNLLPIIVLISSTLATLAQGTLNYANRVTGIIVAPIRLANGPLLTGSGFSAQLFYAAGLDQPQSSLIAAANSITTFRTSVTFAGTIAPSLLTLPGTTVGGSATLQLRAWDNQSGTLTSWAQAEPAWLSGTTAAGMSLVFNISGLADSSAPNPPDMVGLQSFSIYYTPEPGTVALFALGGLGFWVCRRKK